MSKHMTSGHEMVYINGGYKYAHRVAMEKKLGRKLRRDEQVHHKNGKPNDNSPGNLELVSKAEHNGTDPKHHLGGRPKGSKNK